jgi:hypothetical protein
MPSRSIISKDESNILVAIGKLETMFDGMTAELKGVRSEVTEIKNGYANRLLQLEGNAVNKIQYDQLEDRVDALERSRIEYRAMIKAWVIIGGGVWSVTLIVASVLVAKYFGA